MVIALIALVMSTTGSAVAAVSFARNAGAVDRLSAVRASSSTDRAAGKLVATKRSGANKGKIPWKFLADVPNADSFAFPFQVQDNASGTPVTLDATSFGRFEASCRDEAARAGVENPRTVLTFASTSTLPMNYARRVGSNVSVGLLQPGTTNSFEVPASNTFEYHLQQGATHVLIQGAVRQDRPNPATGNCAVWGSVQVIK